MNTFRENQKKEYEEHQKLRAKNPELYPYCNTCHRYYLKNSKGGHTTSKYHRAASNPEKYTLCTKCDEHFDKTCLINHQYINHRIIYNNAFDMIVEWDSKMLRPKSYTNYIIV